MAEWEGKTRGGVSGYKFFVFIIKHLGVSFAYFFLKIVAVYFLFSSHKTFKTTYFYFNKVHKFSKVKSFFSVYQNYCMLGKTLVDKVALLSGAEHNFSYNFSDDYRIRELVDENSGGIIVNAHVGNWEIAGQLLEKFDTRINILMFEAEHERVNKYLANVLSNKKVDFIIIKDGFDHLEKIEKALLNNEIIAMNGDRFMEGNRTMTCTFMGRDAEFPISPYYMAGKFKVPVLYAFAMKEGKKFYHIYATEKKWVHGFNSMKTREAGLQQAVNDYASTLEMMVRKYPLQWFNYYNFWNQTL